MGNCATKLQSELQEPLTSEEGRHSVFPIESDIDQRFDNAIEEYNYLLYDVFICTLLVSGYFRNHQIKFNFEYIPPELCAVCVNYFYEDIDTFNIDNKSTEVYSSSDGVFIQKTNSFNCTSIYGTKLIPSPKDSKSIYKWTFLICKRTGLFVIGLTSNNNENGLFETNALMNDDSKYPYFGYNGFNGAISDGHNPQNGSIQWKYNSGPKLCDTDRVVMELDLAKGQISYFVNDTGAPGVCFFDIQKGVIYRIVVSMYMEGDGIEIQRFEEFNNGYISENEVQFGGEKVVRVDSEDSEVDNRVIHHMPLDGVRFLE